MMDKKRLNFRYFLTVSALIAVSVAVLLFTSACSSNDTGDNQETNQAEDQTQDQTESQNSDEQEDNADAAGKDLGDFYVEVKGAALTTDYEGNPAIVVTYAWTNNSEETTSAMVSMYESAFQNGVQLDTAILVDASFDIDSAMTNVRPGTTIDIQKAYVMTDETAEVEFEVSEFLGFSDEKIFVTFDPASL